MKHAQKSTPESPAERLVRLWLIFKGRIVQPKFRKRVFEHVKILGILRIKTHKHHGFWPFISFQGRNLSALTKRDGVSDTHEFRFLESGCNIANVPCAHFRVWRLLGRKMPYLFCRTLGARCHKKKRVVCLHHTLHHAHVRHHSFESVEMRIKYERAEWLLCFFPGRGHPCPHRFQKFFHALPPLS